MDRVGSVGCTGDAAGRTGDYVYPDEGLLVFSGGDYSANGDGFPPPSVCMAAELWEIANTAHASKLKVSRIFCIG